MSGPLGNTHTHAVLPSRLARHNTRDQHNAVDHQAKHNAGTFNVGASEAWIHAADGNGGTRNTYQQAKQGSRGQSLAKWLAGDRTRSRSATELTRAPQGPTQHPL